MKTKFFNPLHILFFILTITLNFSFVANAQQDVINYSIPEFNKSGSFTIEYGSNLSKTMGDTSDTKNFIRLKDKEDNVKLEVTAKFLKELKNKVVTLNIKSKNDNKTKFVKAKEKMMLDIIDNLINFLRDDTRFSNFKNKNKLSKQHSVLAPTPWSYVLSTIRNLQTTIEGTINN